MLELPSSQAPLATQDMSTMQAMLAMLTIRNNLQKQLLTLTLTPQDAAVQGLLQLGFKTAACGQFDGFHWFSPSLVCLFVCLHRVSESCLPADVLAPRSSQDVKTIVSRTGK